MAELELEKMLHVGIERNVTENRQTEKPITEATLIPWIAGLSGPI